MKELLEKFDLFLRYYVCGSVFVITVFFASGRFSSIKRFLDKEVSFIIPLVLGALIYGVHRNLINPLVERLRRCILAKCRCLLCDEEWKGICFRNGLDEDKTGKQGRNFIKNWGDHIQMLYATAFAIFAGCILSWMFDSVKSGYERNSNLFILWGLLCLAGFFSDIRKQLAEDKLPSLKAGCPNASQISESLGKVAAEIQKISKLV